jgi:hypothetical protein
MSETMLTPMYTGRKGPWGEDARIEAMNADNWGAQLIAPQGPQYMEWVRRGYVFTSRSAAAAALIIYSTATNAPAIWNPADSNKVVVPIRITLSNVAVASAVHTGIVLGWKAACGSAIGTGAPVVTWTNVAPTNNLLGSSKAASTKCAPAVSTFTGIPAVLEDTGLIQNVDGTPATGGFSDLKYDFDGRVMLLPGAVMSVMGIAASVNTFWVSITFAELPYVPGSIT